MNPHRLVAAVAALAIGFGVTLVGVSVADDGDATVSSELDQVGELEDEGDEIDEGGRAEQEEAVAEEADPAEVEPTTSVLADQIESEQGPTSSTCDDLAGSGVSDEELLAAGCDPAESDDANGQRATCRAVYEVTSQDGEQTRVIVKEVQDGGVVIEPDGEFIREGERGVERLDELGFFFVGPDELPLLGFPCEQVGEVVDLDDLDGLPDSEGSIEGEPETDEGASSTTAGSDQIFPCDLPLQRVLDDLGIDGFIDLDDDAEASDWESYITLLDAALIESTGEPSFDWGVQVASTADSDTFQELDCRIATTSWGELFEAPLVGARADPKQEVCFLVQFVELEQRSDGGLDNVFINYLDDFGPATAGCLILESMVL